MSHRINFAFFARLPAIFLLVGLVPTYGDPATDAIAVGGAVEKPGNWTPARIKTELAADLTSISYSSHGQKHSSNAVPLIALLQASGLQTQFKPAPNVDPKVKHFELRLAVAVQGSDGYIVTFSVPELLPEVGNHHVWVVLDADGKPLPEGDGPIRLVVPDDEKPARWVHMLQKITVVNVAEATTQPAH